MLKVTIMASILLCLCLVWCTDALIAGEVNCSVFLFADVLLTGLGKKRLAWDCYWVMSREQKGIERVGFCSSKKQEREFPEQSAL